MPTDVATVAELDGLLKANRFAVVDFYADWCPPCKAIAPVFAQLEQTHGSSGALAFAKVNVDRLPQLAGRYGVTAMPTFMFFDGGAPAAVDARAVAGPSVQTGPNGVELIKGADARALAACAARLAELAKPASRPAADNKAAPQPEPATVSGVYTGPKRADWKMSLNG